MQMPKVPSLLQQHSCVIIIWGPDYNVTLCVAAGRGSVPLPLALPVLSPLNVVMNLVRASLPGVVAADQIHPEGFPGFIDPHRAGRSGPEVGVVQTAARWVRAKRKPQVQSLEKPAQNQDRTGYQCPQDTLLFSGLLSCLLLLCYR